MVNDYNSFNVTDFVIDDVFLKHHLQPTVASQKFWDSWLAHNPGKQKEWQQAKKLVEAVQLGLNDYTRIFLSEEAEEQLLRRIRSTNAQNNESTTYPVFVIQKPLVQSIAVAACILLFISIGAGYFFKGYFDESIYSKLRATLFDSAVIEKANASAEVEKVRLPDGTTVLLSPGSRISYSDDFGKINRTIIISGKVILDVFRDQDKPFVVYANELVTKVLGTRFVVESYEDSVDVIVRVQSGQVSVFKNNSLSEVSKSDAEQYGVVLKPNQQLEFSRQTEEFNKKLVDIPLPILPKDAKAPSFMYEETDVVTVFEDLEKTYGINIIYNKSQIETCQLTASLTNESFKEKLSIICKSIGASYKIIDAHIIIHSSGCKPL